MTAKDRLILLELKHAIAAIERAGLLAAGSGCERDIGRLHEAARATLDLVEVAIQADDGD